MPYLVNIQTAFPENYYSQAVVKEKLLGLWKDEVRNLERVEKILDNVLVEGRHLAMPVEQYFDEASFGQRNDQFIKSSVGLATEAISNLLFQYDLSAKQIGSIWSNTVTGFAIPSLEARVMNKIAFDPSTKRIPMLGLGCMAGVAGINRACDYLKGAPQEAALFFSVELCSLTFQMKDLSLANIVSTCLFGDGAAAVLLVGDEHPLASQAKLKWIDSLSAFFPETEDMMGWQVDEQGLSIQLSKSVPQITEEQIPRLVNNFYERANIKSDEIRSFFAHPGGPKVLMAMEEALGLGAGDLNHSWESLKHNGNMSSVSVLDIMSRHLQEEQQPNDKPYSLSVAMGPAFSAEVGLFEWK